MLIMQSLVVLQFIKLIDVVIVLNVIEAYKDNFIMSNPELKHKLNLKSNIDPKSVHSSQLNSSSSKMQYTMPKSARFSQKKINSSSDAFYEIPDTKSKRSASFGYGNKMDLGKRNFQTPSPYLYNIPSEFNDKKKGITISAGREIIKNNSVFSAVANIPGPGQYNPKNPIIDKSGKQGFTIGCKTEDKTEQWKTKLPGPGNYETLELLDKNLKSSNSRIQNPRSGRFSKSRRVSDFQQSQTKKNPGPGQYDKAFNIEATAKFQSKGGYHFSHSQRQGIIGKSRQITPGPGSYGSFSQFIS